MLARLWQTELAKCLCYLPSSSCQLNVQIATGAMHSGRDERAALGVESRGAHMLLMAQAAGLGPQINTHADHCGSHNLAATAPHHNTI